MAKSHEKIGDKTALPQGNKASEEKLDSNDK